MSLETSVDVIAYIGLGSNLSDPVRQIENARRSIRELDQVRGIAFSSLYRSVPMGPVDQPHYVNAVMGVVTGLSAADLLSAMQMIENKQGRVRAGERWGPRIVDLDLLLYGQHIIKTADLIVPHYGIAERAFVLYPLVEIAPGVVIPGKGRLTELLSLCPPEGIERIKP